MLSAGRVRYLDIPAKLSVDAQGSQGKPRARGTLVLIHAFPMSAEMWEPQFALAEHGWRLIVPQLRGFGGGTGGAPVSSPVSSIDDYAGDVIDLLDALHIDDAVVCGLSLGGYVAFAMFRLAGRYFHALVLADTRPQADAPEAVKARHAMLELVRTKGPSAVADQMLPKLIAPSTLQQHPEVAERLRSLIVANSPDAIAGGLAALMTRPDSTELLGGIHVPTLILVGEEDVLTPPALSEGMHHAIAGSELVTIAGAGHMSNLEQPAAFNAALAKFLTHRV